MPSAILSIKILADAKKAISALDQSSSSASKWSSGLNKSAAVATVGLAALGVVVADGVKAAAEDAQQQAVLANALQKSAGATKGQVAATEDWISKTAMATGVADDQLRPALGNLVRATGSVSESQKAMGLALDISAATGKDVTAVSASLAKGYAGNTAALGRLVPGLDKATLASGDMAAVSQLMADKVGGSAAAAADTAAGQYQIFKVAVDETKEGIGAALLPVLTDLAKHMTGVAKLASENSGKVTILLGVFAGLAAAIVIANGAIKAYNVVTAISSGLTATNAAEVKGNAVATAAYAVKQGVVRVATAAWTAAQWLLNAALNANPVGLVIIAIAALAAGLIYAYKNSETFRRIVDAAFQAVLDAARATWNWIKGSWSALQAVVTAPFNAAERIVSDALGGIKSAGQAVLGWFRSAWDAIGPALTAPFTSAWNVISGIISQIKSAVTAVSNAIRNIPHPSIPDLNPFSAAAPGVSTGARASFAGVATAPAATSGTSGGSGVTINISGALDPEGVARQIQRILTAHQVRVGLTAGVVR